MTNGYDSEANGKVKQEVKAKKREIALKNLGADKLSNLAVAFFAQQENSGFGKIDNDSVEQFLYGPSLREADAYNLETGDKSSLVYDSLVGSRHEGKRYSGQVSEYEIIKTAAMIKQESLTALKVEDLMNLTGSKLNIKAGYQNKYISDLIASENKEDKKLAEILVGVSMNYFTTRGVSKALDFMAEEIRGGLEKLVGEEQKK